MRRVNFATPFAAAFVLGGLATVCAAQDIAAQYPRTTIQIVNPYARAGRSTAFCAPSRRGWAMHSNNR